MTKLSQADLDKFQDAVKKDYGIELKGEKLYQRKRDTSLILYFRTLF